MRSRPRPCRTCSRTASGSRTWASLPGRSRRASRRSPSRSSRCGAWSEDPSPFRARITAKPEKGLAESRQTHEESEHRPEDEVAHEAPRCGPEPHVVPERADARNRAVNEEGQEPHHQTEHQTLQRQWDCENADRHREREQHARESPRREVERDVERSKGLYLAARSTREGLMNFVPLEHAAKAEPPPQRDLDDQHRPGRDQAREKTPEERERVHRITTRQAHPTRRARRRGTRRR